MNLNRSRVYFSSKAELSGQKEDVQFVPGLPLTLHLLRDLQVDWQRRVNIMQSNLSEDFGL